MATRKRKPDRSDYQRGFHNGLKQGQTELDNYKSAYEALREDLKEFETITGLTLCHSGADLREIAQAVQFVSTHRLTGYRKDFERLISLGEQLTEQIRGSLKRFDEIQRTLKRRRKVS